MPENMVWTGTILSAKSSITISEMVHCVSSPKPTRPTIGWLVLTLKPQHRVRCAYVVHLSQVPTCLPHILGFHRTRRCGVLGLLMGLMKLILWIRSEMTPSFVMMLPTAKATVYLSVGSGSLCSRAYGPL